jgi:hypothetical protein
VEGGRERSGGSKRKKKWIMLWIELGKYNSITVFNLLLPVLFFLFFSFLGVFYFFNLFSLIKSNENSLNVHIINIIFASSSFYVIFSFTGNSWSTL